MEVMMELIKIDNRVYNLDYVVNITFGSDHITVWDKVGKSDEISITKEQIEDLKRRLNLVSPIR